MYSYSNMGNWVMAVSTSRAKFLIQFFCLKFRLYFKPLLSNVISSLEKVLFVMLIIPGWNFVGFTTFLY